MLTTQYGFDGRVVKSVLYHRNPRDASRPEGIHLAYWSESDHAGRPLATHQQINGEPVETLSRPTYNELGQVVARQVGSNAANPTPLQNVDYTYNVRGWPVSLNRADLAAGANDAQPDLFGMEWLYQRAEATGVSPLYPRSDGNLTAIRWRSRLDNLTRGFHYQYDALSRLTAAGYTSPKAAEKFSLSGLSYDKNGNLGGLTREGLVGGATGDSPTFGVVDQLTYSYGSATTKGNQLRAVRDNAVNKAGQAGDFVEPTTQGSAEYRYDANGNLTADDNKGMTSVQYNHLDLPATIWYEASGQNRLDYGYDAAGTRLRKQIYQGGGLVSTTDYAGPFHYVNDQLQFIDTPEGRALPPASGNGAFAYEYHFTDQVGNLRLAYRRGSTDSRTATMEAVNAAGVQMQCSNLASLPRVTDLCEGDQAIVLSPTHPMGPMRLLKVSKGDRISARVKARYSSAASRNNGAELNLFLQGYPGGNVPGQEGSNANRPALSVGISLTPRPDGAPASVPNAYLRLVAYNAEGQVVGNEPPRYVNSQDCLGELAISDYQVQQEGYVRVYLANESDAPAYFDELVVTHQQALIVQEQHYDPFGLHLVGIEKDGSYPYHYNGLSEKTSDPTGKGYFYETDWRGYDPQLGRFRGIDALTHSMPGITPYHYAYNNPVLFNDPTGEHPVVAAVLAFVGSKAAGYAAYRAGASPFVVSLASFAGGAIGSQIGNGWGSGPSGGSGPTDPPGAGSKAQGSGSSGGQQEGVGELSPRAMAQQQEIAAWQQRLADHPGYGKTFWDRFTNPRLYWDVLMLEGVHEPNPTRQVAVMPEAATWLTPGAVTKVPAAASSAAKAVPRLLQAARGGPKLLGTARDNLLNTVTNPKLRNIINDLYRPGAKVGSGSTADYVRTIGDSVHITKARNYVNGLRDLLPDVTR